MQAHDALAALQAGRAAFKLGRTVRAVERFERALAAADADASLLRDSLLRAVLLAELALARVRSAEPPLSRADQERRARGGVAEADEWDDWFVQRAQAACVAAWRAEPRAVALSQRALALLLARCAAGTLFAPLTAVELAATNTGGDADEENGEAPRARQNRHPLPPQRAACLFSVAQDAVASWPPLRDPAAEEARLRGVAGAARAALELYNHYGGATRYRQRARGLPLAAHDAVFVFGVLARALDESGAFDGLVHKLRAINALTRAEENALRRRVLPAVLQLANAGQASLMSNHAEDERRAAEDVARHGLRACARPGCAATEPQPKAFKVCARCRRACYCSAAHQQQDWRRHKREDACAAAPPQ
jgi:hypothetical protein